MEAELLPEVQKVVRPNEHILRRHGIALGKDARILDFGCWSGRHTYEYLDAGYERVVGFDIEDHVSLRKDSDLDRFRFSEPGGTYRIPFPDNHFDFITSISVFEHVTNQAEAITEIARVLKPDGVTLHVFRRAGGQSSPTCSFRSAAPYRRAVGFRFGRDLASGAEVSGTLLRGKSFRTILPFARPGTAI